MKRKLVTIVLSIAVIASLIFVGCAPKAPPEATYHWRWSHYQPIDSLQDRLSHAAVEEIAEQSDGRIVIDIYPASQLGDWMEVSEEIMRGVVEIGLMPVSMVYDPRLALRVLPYAVMNWDEAEEFYAGEDPFLFNTMEKMMAGSDLKALAIAAEGMGGGGFIDIPTVDVLDPDVDKGGLKMRFPPGNRAWELLVEALGFRPTPLPWGDLYMGLQTGLVDCQIGGQPYNTWTSFRDVVTCWVQYNTHFQNSFFYMNLDLWNSLSEEDQAIIKNACVRQAERSFVEARTADGEYMNKMRDQGIKIIVPTDEQLAKIAEKVRTEVWPVMDPIIGKGTMNELRIRMGLEPV